MKRGIQITNQRLGKLEKEMLSFALSLNKNSIIYDLGGGNGFLSLILALFHHQVNYYDLNPSWKLKIIKNFLKLKRLKIYKKNFLNLDLKHKNKVKIFYSARAIHYLNYQEMEKLFSKISKLLENEGKIFINLSGLDSEIGNGYECKKEKVEKRFCKLNKKYQNRFQIKEKISLLNLKEFQELAEKYFKIEKIWESNFRNLFLIAGKK